jgi:hypothetical protein
MTKISLGLSHQSSEFAMSTGFTAGKFGLRQEVDRSGDIEKVTTNFEMVPIEDYLPKSIFSDNAINSYQAIEGTKMLIIDPLTLMTALTITPPENPRDGDTFTLAFGGSNITTGQVIRTLTMVNCFIPNQVISNGYNSIKAGESITFTFDSYVNKWRCVYLNRNSS